MLNCCIRSCKRADGTRLGPERHQLSRFLTWTTRGKKAKPHVLRREGATSVSHLLEPEEPASRTCRRTALSHSRQSCIR